MGTLQPNLVPLCELKALLEPAIAVTLLGRGGLQIGEVAEAHITGSRFSGVMIGTASDWLTIARDGSWGRMDVRGSFKADDGAIFAVRYGACIRFDRHEASASLEMLANISLYWFTGAIGSSFWPYYERMHGARRIPNGAQVTVPVGYAEFPRDVLSSPRSLAARTFTDIRRLTRMPKGGHFAALEQPELLAADIIAFFAGLG